MKKFVSVLAAVLIASAAAQAQDTPWAQGPINIEQLPEITVSAYDTRNGLPITLQFTSLRATAAGRVDGFCAIRVRDVDAEGMPDDAFSDSGIPVSGIYKSSLRSETRFVNKAGGRISTRAAVTSLNVNDQMRLQGRAGTVSFTVMIKHQFTRTDSTGDQASAGAITSGNEDIVAQITATGGGFRATGVDTINTEDFGLTRHASLQAAKNGFFAGPGNRVLTQAAAVYDAGLEEEGGGTLLDNGNGGATKIAISPFDPARPRLPGLVTVTQKSNSAYRIVAGIRAYTAAQAGTVSQALLNGTVTYENLIGVEGSETREPLTTSEFWNSRGTYLITKKTVWDAPSIANLLSAGG